ncbi:MAG: hypothetical protein ACRDQH_10870 [Pseudonocardiaceae bacterium]
MRQDTSALQQLLAECYAEPRHPRIWIEGEDKGWEPPVCPFCAHEAFSRQHATCGHNKHGRWRTWKITHRFFSWTYTMGITIGGGVVFGCGCPGCVIVPKMRGKRSYILGVSTDHWRCLLRGHHWPGEHIGMGLCGKCAPCVSCGSTRVRDAQRPMTRGDPMTTVNGDPDAPNELSRRVQVAVGLVETMSASSGNMAFAVADVVDTLRRLFLRPGAATDPLVQAVARALLAPTVDVCEAAQAAKNDLGELDGDDQITASLAGMAETLDPYDPVVEAVARALLGTDQADEWPACSQCGGSGHQPCAPGSPLPASGTTQDDTEWAAYWGADNPNVEWRLLPFGPSGFIECENRWNAEELSAQHGGKVARRTVTRGPWQVVTTEGGE